jgi:hypothetical protein
VVGDKTLNFRGKSVDVAALQKSVLDYLHTDGFVTQSSNPSPDVALIQAKKGGWLAGIIAADRALTISITGKPDDCQVRIGIGKWMEHLVVTALETLFVSGLFLVVDVAETAWNLEVEQKLVKAIESFVG